MPRLPLLSFLLAGTSVEAGGGGDAGSTGVGTGGGVVVGWVATEVDDEDVEDVEAVEAVEVGIFSTTTDAGVLVDRVNSNEGNTDSDAAGRIGVAEDDETGGAGADSLVGAATTEVVETTALGMLVTRASVVVE
jgi:hypothetical protein